MGREEGKWDGIWLRPNGMTKQRQVGAGRLQKAYVYLGICLHSRTREEAWSLRHQAEGCSWQITLIPPPPNLIRSQLANWTESIVFCLLILHEQDVLDSLPYSDIHAPILECLDNFITIFLASALTQLKSILHITDKLTHDHPLEIHQSLYIIYNSTIHIIFCNDINGL